MWNTEKLKVKYKQHQDTVIIQHKKLQIFLRFMQQIHNAYELTT